MVRESLYIVRESLYMVREREPIYGVRERAYIWSLVHAHEQLCIAFFNEQ